MKKDQQVSFQLPRNFSWISILFIALLTGCNGCKKTTECGTWVFNGTASGSGRGSDFNVSSAFTFHPDSCGKACTCDTDCIIQMVVVINMDDWSYEYASDQTGAPARATAEGWAIDQIDGWAYAYYGINNDGTFDNGYNNAGSNGVATTLFDDPQGWPANTLFYALDVTTCYKSAGCQNSILGYYFWSWSIDNTGKPSAFITAPAWKDLDLEFQKAATGWNNWAPTSPSQDEGGGQPILPHAITLPTLTDL